jgi:two-component system chemotaxis response regulator CheY
VHQASVTLDFALMSFLIIDDQPFTRRIVRSILTGFGSREIYESGNGAEALDLVRTVTPSLIITDLVMPVFNGARFISLMKTPPSPAHNIPIIVLSGYLTKTAALAMRGSGADELLVKPVSPKALYAHISRIVLRHDQASHPMAMLQRPKRGAERQRNKAGDLAYL